MINPFSKKRDHLDDCSCSDCQQKVGTPLGYGSVMPASIEGFTKKQLKRRVVLTDDLCVVDEAHFFVYGCVELPIVREDEIFSWNVWVSLSADNFFRMLDLWEEPSRVELDPMFGWFATELPGYPDTLNLKTNVHIRDVGVRPFIELEPTNHPLAVEQRQGITRQRIVELTRMLGQYKYK